jgi:hypothetical protein
MIVHYHMRRDEVWRWYWQRWRENLWKSWLLAGLMAFAWPLLVRGRVDLSGILIGLLMTLAVFLFFTLYPQAMFKSQERTLEIGAGGIDTEIGGKRAHRDWNEIASISEKIGMIVFLVARTGNAFLVPDRAFANSGERATYLNQAQNWLAASKKST